MVFRNLALIWFEGSNAVRVDVAFVELLLIGIHRHVVRLEDCGEMVGKISLPMPSEARDPPYCPYA
jgi:hypothetical protein